MPDSILDKIKRALGLTVTPVFAVDDTPPTLEDGDARPGQLDKTTGGIKVHVVGDDTGGGGGGDAVTTAFSEVTITSSESDDPLDTLIGWSASIANPRSLTFAAPEANAGIAYIATPGATGSKGIPVYPGQLVTIDDNPALASVSVRLSGADTVEVTLQRGT